MASRRERQHDCRRAGLGGRRPGGAPGGGRQRLAAGPLGAAGRAGARRLRAARPTQPGPRAGPALAARRRPGPARRTGRARLAGSAAGLAFVRAPGRLRGRVVRGHPSFLPERARGGCGDRRRPPDLGFAMDAAGLRLPAEAGPGSRRHGGGGHAAARCRRIRHRLHHRPRLGTARRDDPPCQLGAGRIARRRRRGRRRIPSARGLSAPGMAAGRAAHRRQAPCHPTRRRLGHPARPHAGRAVGPGRADRRPGRSAGRHRARRGASAGLCRRRPRHRMGLGRAALLDRAGPPRHRGGPPHLSRAAQPARLLVARQYPRSPAPGHVGAGVGYGPRHGPAHADHRLRTQRLSHPARRAAGGLVPGPGVPGCLRHPVGGLRRAGRIAIGHERAAGRAPARDRRAAPDPCATPSARLAHPALPAARGPVAQAGGTRSAAAVRPRPGVAGRALARVQRRAGRPFAGTVPHGAGGGRTVLPARLGRRRAAQAAGAGGESLPGRGPCAHGRADGRRRTQRDRGAKLCPDGAGRAGRRRRARAGLAARSGARQRRLAERLAGRQPLQASLHGLPAPIRPPGRLRNLFAQRSLARGSRLSAGQRAPTGRHRSRRAARPARQRGQRGRAAPARGLAALAAPAGRQAAGGRPSRRHATRRRAQRAGGLPGRGAQERPGPGPTLRPAGRPGRRRRHLPPDCR
ncbi:hypothetical protein LMG1231_06180 [Achromobacter denitrificans]|nr:hypothetical protein LMG1231_06180 [Achromobacter denitrificans]